jgi:hypothetical protein
MLLAGLRDRLLPPVAVLVVMPEAEVAREVVEADWAEGGGKSFRD